MFIGVGAEYKRRIGREAHYLPDLAGFVHAEEMLFAPDFMQRLRQAGIAHLGMITGDMGHSVVVRWTPDSA